MIVKTCKDLNGEDYKREVKEKIFKWWCLEGKRDFPWRETKDPYKVIIAEILLHRTRASQVIPFYKMFLKKYPNLKSIVLSSSEEMEKDFYSLGLRWRWKLLYLMALEIEKKFDGKIPKKFEDLCSLPGVNHYIASAVRCFSMGYPDVVLDTNTIRVAGRIFGLKISDNSRRDIKFKKVLEEIKDVNKSRDFNFMLIDFAATICKSFKPLHKKCPVKDYCNFFNTLSKY